MIVRLTHEEQALRLQWACDWLAGYGIRLNPGRVALYKRDLQELATQVERGAGLAFEKKMGRHWITNAVVEATELIEIHEGLKGSSDPHLAQLLQEFVGGGAIRHEENFNNARARNTGFHLWFASAAAKCGLRISLSPPADVSIFSEGSIITTECKRLLSEQNVRSLIRKGFSGLKKRYREHTSAEKIYGLLAVSISKLFSSAVEAVDETELRQKQTERFRWFGEKYASEWSKRRTGREVGLLIHWSGPVYVKEPYLMAVATDFRFVPLHDGDQEKEYYFRALGDTFNQLIPPKIGSKIHLGATALASRAYVWTPPSR